MAHLRPADEVLLRAEHLTVEFPVGRTGLKVHAVSDISLDIKEGETLGLVGESGCGKSTTGRAMMQFPPPTDGSVDFDGVDLTQLAGEELRRTRTQMQMIFQDPISSLNPRRKVGDIVAEPLSIWSKAPPDDRSVATVVSATVAWAVTAALAVGAALLVISAVLALFGVGDDEVKIGPVATSSGGGDILVAVILATVLGVAGLWFFEVGRRISVRADDGRSSALLTFGLLGFAALAAVSFADVPAAVVGLVVGIAAAGLVPLFTPGGRADFPDVDEEGNRIVDQVLETVGLDPETARTKRPHEFSGGQCQRISIARALVLDPKLIICDEPVSALDVSVQAQILNLLEDMKARYGLTLIFIAHDLAVVKNVSDRVAVMYLGKLCEVSDPDKLYGAPAHPYTDALLGAIPVPDPTVRPSEEGALSGELPSPVAPPSGCRFRTRCPRAEDRCEREEPVMRKVEDNHYVACHFPLVDLAEA